MNTTMIIKGIEGCPLFKGINETQLEALLNCLSAAQKSYKKDSFIFNANDKAIYVGIVLSGGVYVIQEDFWGNRAILANIGKGGLFGEALSCAKADKLPVSVIAAVDSKIMLINYKKLVTSCSSACRFHTQLIMNMLEILARKNIMLTGKIEHLSKRTIRDKLLSYLSAQAAAHGGRRLEIPFNRQELADYLCVDRSALSRELSLMQKEGLLKYERNSFVLLRRVQ